jgi:excisionase family DNA binding protein
MKPPSHKKVIASHSGSLKSSREQRMFTRQELAQRWSCSVRTIDRIITSGALRAYRIGRSIRVAEEDERIYLALQRID